MQLSPQEKAVLVRHMLFADLSEAQLTEALSFFHARRAAYVKGDLLHSAGEPLSHFGLVLHGAVQVAMDDMDGNRLLMASVAQSESFGESLCFLRIQDSPVFISATEDSVIVWLSTNGLHHAPSTPEQLLFFERFCALLATRALTMNDRVQVLSKTTIRQKIVTFLSQCENRYGARTFRIPLDRNALAVYLGVNRAALSRELSAMKQEGLIDFYRNTFRLLP